MNFRVNLLKIKIFHDETPEVNCCVKDVALEDVRMLKGARVLSSTII
jgi:hypothetical protein